MEMRSEKAVSAPCGGKIIRTLPLPAFVCSVEMKKARPALARRDNEVFMQSGGTEKQCRRFALSGRFLLVDSVLNLGA